MQGTAAGSAWRPRRSATRSSEDFARLGRTFKELRLYRQLLIFIVAFWIYNDGIGTIIKMATIYGAEIGIGTIDLIGALLLTQFIGIPFSLLFGRLPRKEDPKQSFFLSTVIFSAIAIPARRYRCAPVGHHQRTGRGGDRSGCAGASASLFSWFIGRASSRRWPGA